MRVVWPTVAVFALLFDYLSFNLGTSNFLYISWPVGIVINLLALLWGIRQALQQSYPQGVFRLIPHELPSPRASGDNSIDGDGKKVGLSAH